MNYGCSLVEYILFSGEGGDKYTHLYSAFHVKQCQKIRKVLYKIYIIFVEDCKQSLKNFVICNCPNYDLCTGSPTKHDSW